MRQSFMDWGGRSVTPETMDVLAPITLTKGPPMELIPMLIGAQAQLGVIQTPEGQKTLLMLQLIGMSVEGGPEIRSQQFALSPEAIVGLISNLQKSAIQMASTQPAPGRKQ